MFFGCGAFISPMKELRRAYPDNKIWHAGYKHYVVQLDENCFMYVNHGVFGLEYMPLIEYGGIELRPE